MNLFDKVVARNLSSALLRPLWSVQSCVYLEGDSTPYHSAPYAHAILVLDGEAFFQEQGMEEFACKRGTFFAIPPKAVYKWRIAKTASMIQCLHRPFSFLEHRGLAKLFGSSNKHIRYFKFAGKDFEACVKDLEADSQEAEPLRGLKLSADWLKAMAIATSMFNAGDRSEHPSLVKAVDFLTESAGRNVSLKELSKKAGLGASRLTQLFREELGMPPLRYHATLKAELASNLLAIDELSACEVAERLGFASASAFRRFYKRTTGKTPGEAANRKGGR